MGPGYFIQFDVLYIQTSHTYTRTSHNRSTALWILSGTTQVSRYQKKHSPTHTHHGHQISLICFLRLLRSMVSSLFNPRTLQSFSTTLTLTLYRHQTAMNSFQCLLSWTSYDRVTNPNPTDLKHKIRIRRKRILAGFITSLLGRTSPKWVHFLWSGMWNMISFNQLVIH